MLVIEGVPDEDRHPEHRHAGRAHADDRGDEVDATEDRAETGHPEAHDPEVTTDAGAAYGVRQRRVGEPAEVGGTLRREEARGGDQAAEQEQPVAEHVEARERHVGRADLQRHDDVGEAEEQRRREQQQHDRAVHGEQLVVELLVDDLLARVGQLGADQHGHEAADQEPRERRDQVHLADQLVVGRREDPDDLLTQGLARRLARRGAATGWRWARSLLAPFLVVVLGRGRSAWWRRSRRGAARRRSGRRRRARRGRPRSRTG